MTSGHCPGLTSNCPKLLIYLRAWFMSSPSRMSIVKEKAFQMDCVPSLGGKWNLRSAIGNKAFRVYPFLGRALLRFSLKYGSFSLPSLMTEGAKR